MVKGKKWVGMGNKQTKHEHFNALPNDKNLDWSKFKAFADDKINVT